MITEKNLAEAMEKVIKLQVERIIEEEIKLVSARVMERVRGETGRILAQALTHYSIQKFGSDLTITVKFDGLKE